MDLEYVYTKLRSEFGKQCSFYDMPPEIIDEVLPDHRLGRNYILKDPVDVAIQFSATLAEHEINTESTKFVTSAMNHTEGGWPKDVNLNDEEQPRRYRRKIEKDENYVATVLKLSKHVEYSVAQNTSINIYQHYFSDLTPAPLVEKSYARTVNVYQDQCTITRPVSHISWSPGAGNKLAITYCDLEFRLTHTQSFNSYIWDVENPNCPNLILRPPVPLVCLEYHIKDTNCLVAGMINGQVSLWDARRGHDLISVSTVEESHRDPVRSVIWINSKTGTEFFSGSSDGQLKWWDIRKLSTPTETLILDMIRLGEEQSLYKAQGVSSLEYEPTIPTRFMVGTEHGCVLIGNRKGKLPHEKLIGRVNRAQFGPLYALQRNPAFLKIFLTVGDWSCKIWTEDCKDNPIISTKYYKKALTGGAWSPIRYSAFYVTRVDGTLDVWDILQTQKYPTLSIKLCDESITANRIQEMGRLIALGTQKGTTYLVELSDNFISNQPHEKLLLTQMFERESHREKIMEAKLRELRLKSKTKSMMPTRDEPLDDEEVIQYAEDEFYSTIENELSPPTPMEPPPPPPEPEPIEPEPVPEIIEMKVKQTKKTKAKKKKK